MGSDLMISMFENNENQKKEINMARKGKLFRLIFVNDTNYVAIKYPFNREKLKIYT